MLLPAIVLSAMLYVVGLSTSCERSPIYLPLAANLVFLQNFVSEPFCNNHPLWSLSSEAFFYLVAPVVIFAMSKPSPIALAGCALIAAVCWVSWTGDYFSPAFGLLLWSMGMLPWFVRLSINPIIPLLIFGCVLTLSRGHYFPNDFLSEIFIAFTYVVFLCSRFPESLSLGSHFGKSFAAFSYSLYLVHMPIAQAFTVYLGRKLDPSAVASYVLYSVFLTVILIVAWIFGYVFERRTREVREFLRVRFR